MSTILALSQAYPALALVAIALVVIIAAKCLAHFTAKKPDNHGLIFTYQNPPRNRR